jgi:hypothetical protein
MRPQARSSCGVGLIGTITVDIDHELAQLDPTGHRALRKVFQRVIRWGMPEGMISYRHDNGAWLNAAEDHALALATSAHSPGWTLR